MIGKTQLLVLALAAAGCGTDFQAEPAPRTFQFGPFQLASGQEDTDLCVAVSLHNDEPIYVNAAQIAGAPGIHHSNWFWVPDNDAFDFPEGSWSCSTGGGTGHPFDQSAAAVFGGVLMAQSTQVYNEVQQFPEGAAIYIPPHSRIVADIHLFNASDSAVTVPVALTIMPIWGFEVHTQLAGFSMEDMSLALPPNVASSFTVECDFTQAWQNLYQQGDVDSPQVDFQIYHALAHYHQWGTGLQFEALRDSDGGADMIWSTSSGIGDHLGGVLDPPFDLTGHSKLRLTCDYENNTASTISWGNAGGEMCIAFAFTNSTRVWTAGVVTQGDPGPSVTQGGVTAFTAPSCTVTSVDGQH